jgi:hypothetical protein
MLLPVPDCRIVHLFAFLAVIWSCRHVVINSPLGWRVAGRHGCACSRTSERCGDSGKDSWSTRPDISSLSPSVAKEQYWICSQAFLLDHPLTSCTESTPVLGPESRAEAFNIGGTIQSTNSSLYLNIVSASTSYKPITFSATSETTAWGLEGDTIITVQGSSFGRREWKAR